MEKEQIILNKALISEIIRLVLQLILLIGTGYIIYLLLTNNISFLNSINI